MQATFGAGCFWCIEAVFQKIKGIEKIEVGYASGHTSKPDYLSVCSGTTGHAEVCHITFDPKTISYEQLLQLFWECHDPTTPNRQGNDVGSQYRSLILCHNDEQKKEAIQMRHTLEKSHTYSNPIVTEIQAFEADNFYVAEPYHQKYYSNNPNQSYCQYIIKPKLEKITHLRSNLYV